MVALKCLRPETPKTITYLFGTTDKFTIDAQDVKLVTALLVLGALAFAQWQKNRAAGTTERG